MIRCLLISIMCLLHSACPPPPPPHLQILHTLLFSNPLGRTVYFQKDMNTIPYAKFAGRCVRTRCASSSLFSSTEPCCHGIFFGRVQTRALESKITPTYMHQKDRTLIKRVHLLRFLYPSLLQNLLSLFDRQSHQALVEAFQNVDYMVLKWKH